MLFRSDLPSGPTGIVGSRAKSWPDVARMRRFVDRIVGRIVEIDPSAMVLSGGANGVDEAVRHSCLRRGFCNAAHIRSDPTSVDCPRPHFIEFLAEWRVNGELDRKAGFERNDRLVRHCALVLAILAPGEWTPGTRDTINRCHEYEVPVRIYHEGKWT